jgi:protein-disulfide isomerase
VNKLSTGASVGSAVLLAFLTLTQCSAEDAAPKIIAAPNAPAASAKVALNIKDDAEAAVKVPIDGLPAYGDPRAFVTVVAFVDYECPYCARAENTIETLRDEYGDKLRLVVAMNPLPMHDHAAIAARAFLAAEAQGKGEAMHKKLFSFTADKKPLTDATITQAARDVGLDLDAFDRARSGGPVSQELAKHEALATKLGVHGTPTFFVNGRRFVGAQPIDKFRTVMDDEAVKGAKTASNEPYAILMRDAPEADPKKFEKMDFPADDGKIINIAPGTSPTRGAANAPNTIVMFSDFECPFCVKLEKTLKQLDTDKPGSVKLVYKFLPLPMHAHARLAAKAALAAERQGKFWEYHDALLEHRTELERDSLTKYAGDLGLDTAKFEKDLDDPALEDRIKADEKDAETVGAKGTPHSFVNGRRVWGAQPLAQWQSLIEQTQKK